MRTGSALLGAMRRSVAGWTGWAPSMSRSMRSRSQSRVTASPSSAVASSTWGSGGVGATRAQLGDVDRLDVGQRAEHGHARERPHRVFDDPAPVVVGDVVENHADDASGAVQLLDPSTAAAAVFTHRPGVDHKHHRAPMMRATSSVLPGKSVGLAARSAGIPWPSSRPIAPSTITRSARSPRA